MEYFSDKYESNLRDMLIKEYQIYYNSIKERLNKENEKEIYKEIKKEFSTYSNYQKVIISDLFSGITKNKLNLKYSHESSYWKGENRLPAEAFVHFTGASITNNEGIELIKKYFPKSLKIYNEIINNSLKEK